LFWTASKTQPNATDFNLCNITLAYFDQVDLQSTASVTFSFYDPEFYTAMVIYTIQTQQNGHPNLTAYTGNSLIRDAFVPPSGIAKTGLIVRSSTTVVIGTTVNLIENCYDSLPLVVWGGLIQSVHDDCKVTLDSLNEYSLISVSTEASDKDSFYSYDNIGYNFTVQFQKTAYWKLTKLLWGADDGEVATWCILFVFGLIGMVQLLANIQILAWDHAGMLDYEKKLRDLAVGKKSEREGKDIEMEEEKA